jgi:hypothetical protein
MNNTNNIFNINDEVFIVTNKLSFILGTDIQAFSFKVLQVKVLERCIKEYEKHDGTIEKTYKYSLKHKTLASPMHIDNDNIFETIEEANMHLQEKIKKHSEKALEVLNADLKRINKKIQFHEAEIKNADALFYS